MDGVCESMLAAILTAAVFCDRVISQSGPCGPKQPSTASLSQKWNLESETHQLSLARTERWRLTKTFHPKAERKCTVSRFTHCVLTCFGYLRGRPRGLLAGVISVLALADDSSLAATSAWVAEPLLSTPISSPASFWTCVYVSHYSHRHVTIRRVYTLK